MTRLFAAVVAVTIGLPAAAFEGHEPTICAPAVTRIMTEAGVAQSNVSDTAYLKEKLSGPDGVVIGYNAWSRLNSCRSGYLVIEMHLDCSVAQIYTFGECRVKGVEEG